MLEMLNVVSKLDKTAFLRPQLDRVLNELQEAMEKILVARTKLRAETSADNVARLRLRPPSRFPISLSWPDFLHSPTDTVGARNDDAPGFASREGMIAQNIAAFWGDHQPTAQDWLRCLILLHPAMHESVTAELSELEGTSINTPADAAAPADDDASVESPAPASHN